MSNYEFSNTDINQTCKLMLQDSDYKDLEDTVQDNNFIENY